MCPPSPGGSAKSKKTASVSGSQISHQDKYCIFIASNTSPQFACSPERFPAKRNTCPWAPTSDFWANITKTYPKFATRGEASKETGESQRGRQQDDAADDDGGQRKNSLAESFLSDPTHKYAGGVGLLDKNYNANNAHTATQKPHFTAAGSSSSTACGSSSSSKERTPADFAELVRPIGVPYTAATIEEVKAVLQFDDVLARDEWEAFVLRR